MKHQWRFWLTVLLAVFAQNIQFQKALMLQLKNSVLMQLIEGSATLHDTFVGEDALCLIHTEYQFYLNIYIP